MEVITVHNYRCVSRPAARSYSRLTAQPFCVQQKENDDVECLNLLTPVRLQPLLGDRRADLFDDR